MVDDIGSHHRHVHKNGYTVGKIRGILKRLDFGEREISRSRWKGDRDPMISVLAVKN